MTVRDDNTLCDKVAFTEMLLNGDVANALQISAVPSCALLLTTSVHVKPPPVMLVTVAFALEPSDATNANSSSFAALVENAELITVVLAAL
jgi:hypothetical protein